jgi:exonuclease SbcD
MKILHTSDWHLGQKFLYNDRIEEHELALQWLLDTINEQEVEGLIIAGDIFDIGNPPNYARRMYYRFLTDVLKTSCRHVAIIGGNHDSPSMLHAPKEILEALSITVVGATTEDLQDEIIEWKSADGQLEAVIAAVPFLRDRDVKYSTAGESGLSRVEHVREGIKKHYKDIGQLVEDKYGDQNIPKIVTGHLYATGAAASAKQDNIYIGDIENISASQFPAIFDYVALGHIHRPQIVGGLDKVRYSGSIIPLSFSETKDEKSVSLLSFVDGVLTTTQLPIPVFRRLKTIEGSLEEVEKRLLAFSSKEREGLSPWVEVMVETDKMIPQLDRHLRKLVEDREVEILKIKVRNQYLSLSAQELSPELDDLEVIDVFKMKCKSYGADPEEMDTLVATFIELQDWYQQKELP